MNCDNCGCELDDIDYYENDGFCDECLENDAFDHMGIHIVREYRTLDEEIVPCIESECVTILYGQIEASYRRPRSA